MDTSAHTGRIALTGLTVLAGETVVTATHTGGAGTIATLVVGAAVYHAVGEMGKQRISSDWLYRLWNGKSTREEKQSLPEQPRAKSDNIQQEPLQSKPVVRTNGQEDVLQPILDFQGSDTLPPPIQAPTGPFFFSDVLKAFTPSLKKIYLATLPDGKPVFVQAKDLCHTALAGGSRGGKSQIVRQLMSQLCYAGANVYHLDPHYTRWDLESYDPSGNLCPEDWTPFEKWLKNDPRELIPQDRKYKIIEHYLRVAYELVGKRLEARGLSDKPLGAPHFLFLDEVPAIVDEVPDAPRYLKKILREGAKVGVFVVTASQDFHVSTVFKDVGGGIRQCMRTALDVGSDPHTQNALGLPVVKGLGKGKITLRCDGENQTALISAARVPYVDNAALYRLLGPSTYTPALPTHEEEQLEAPSVLKRPVNEQSQAMGKIYHSHGIGDTETRRRERIARLRGTIGRHTEDIQRTNSEDDLLARGIQAYKGGATTLDKLMAALDITQHRARQLMLKIKEAVG